MIEFGLLPLGVLLFFIGLAFFGVTFLVLRAVPKIRPISSAEKQNPISLDIPTHTDAILMVAAGGLVSYLNDEARNWFNLWDEDPNLDRMARLTRPSDTFLGLCATEGQARFSIKGQMVEGTSYTYPVDRETYDLSIELLAKAIHRTKLGISEKTDALNRLGKLRSR